MLTVYSRHLVSFLEKHGLSWQPVDNILLGGLYSVYCLDLFYIFLLLICLPLQTVWCDIPGSYQVRSTAIGQALAYYRILKMPGEIPKYFQKSRFKRFNSLQSIPPISHRWENLKLLPRNFWWAPQACRLWCCTDSLDPLLRHDLEPAKEKKYFFIVVRATFIK